MIIAVASINNCSLSEIGLGLYSSIDVILVVLLFNAKVLAFVKTKERNEKLFCNWFW